MKLLTLANGHGRYITATPERTLFSVGGMAITLNRYKCVVVSILKRLRNGRCTSEPPCGGFGSKTATWIQKWFYKSVGTSRNLYI
jgi:hypothetical protein